MNEAIQIQACQFRRTKNSRWESGIAKVLGFGVSDVDWIVDAAGKPIGTQLWDYRLDEGPLCYIELPPPENYGDRPAGRTGNVMKPIAVLTATCPVCGSIVAAHVIGEPLDDEDICRIVREAVERGHEVAVAYQAVTIGRCRCEETPAEQETSK